MMKSFTVNMSEENLLDLQRRILTTRWAPFFGKTGWENGADEITIRSLVEYWGSGFNWRKTEAQINAHPNFMTDINGSQIHFQYIRGSGDKTLPLLISHGWPGSFIEMEKLIPLLTCEGPFSFDLVIPSIPGFGFSRSPQPLSSSGVADIWNILMKELGYKKYIVQGGDIGAGISTWLGLKYPESVIGMHLNFIPGSYQPFNTIDTNPSSKMDIFRNDLKEWIDREGAYSHLHATKPGTQAYGLNDSPVGLCAWIVEKFYSWSDNNGEIESVFSKDELLSNISLYWLTQTIYSSMQIYKENKMTPLVFGRNDFVKCPVAFALFPKELPTPPREWVERGYNIQRWTEMKSGGHFAAMEQPVLLANDIFEFSLDLLLYDK
jgi:pimeloyl-ACP methyl ester carboxylesterase